MLKIIMSGCNGRMGQVITRMVGSMDDAKIVAGIDLNTVQLSDYPVYAAAEELTEEADVVIDFTHTSALTPLLTFCIARKLPVVLSTTGYSAEQMEEIKEASKYIPIFKSANMSLGINVVADLLRRAASILGEGYDVEIVERHHNQKLDAPSGTALMLADAVSEALPYEAEYVYDRSQVRQKRGKTEIGISAVRGGTITGDHEVIFAGPDEVIEIHHHAQSREVFANGAVRAARYLAGVTEPGLYNMQMLVKSI